MKASRRFISLILTFGVMVSLLSVLTLFETPVYAASEQTANFTPLSAQEAEALIGFLCDTNSVSSEMKNAGNMYKLMTGQLEPGSAEEAVAMTTFSAFASSSINKNIDQSNLVVTATSAHLVEFLESKIGSIDDDTAKSILDDVKKSTSEVMSTCMDLSDEALSTVADDMNTIIQTVDGAQSAVSKCTKLFDVTYGGFLGLLITGNQNRRAMYTYVATKIDNLSSPAYQYDDVAEIMDAYNEMATNQNNIFANLFAGNRWNDVENKELLETFATFIYEINRAATTQSAGKHTVVQVHCPTNVTALDNNGNKLLEIIDDEITVYDDSCFAAVNNSMKLLVFPEITDYTIEITGTDTGTMDYAVNTYNEGGLLRELKFSDLPVTEDSSYTSTLPEEIFAETEAYDLITEENETITADYDSLPELEVDISDVIGEQETVDGFSKALIEQVANALFSMESSVDISAHSVPAQDIPALFTALSQHYPTEYSLIKNSGFSYKTIVSTANQTAISLRFYYGDGIELSEYQKRVQDLKDVISKVVSNTEGMGDFETALFLHDYIVLNCQYDEEFAELLLAGQVTDEMNSERNSEYSVLVNQTGICGSYALAYKALMTEAGVECICVYSTDMRHAWNMVKLDGEWYHVDCCWDDPVPDQTGTARRKYFLLNDEEIKALDHYNWQPTGYPSDSTIYSDMSRNTDNRQKFYDGSWYALEKSALWSKDLSGASSEKLLDTAASALDVANGYVYYSEAWQIYRYSLKDKTTEPVYGLPVSLLGKEPRNAYIVNFYTESDGFTLYISRINAEGEREVTKSRVSVDLSKPLEITGLQLDQTVLSLGVFESKALTASPMPAEAVTDAAITWSSSDETVATVDDAGVVTANNVGTATITASLFDWSCSCTVTVTGDGQQGTDGNIQWVFEPETGTLTLSGNGSMKSHSESNTPWNDLKKQIRSVVVEDGVTTIGSHAFDGLVNLESAVLPDSITEIGGSAFYRCLKLREIDLPDNLQYINGWAFWAVGLEEVILPDSVLDINSYAFAGCDNLERIIIGANLNYLHRDFVEVSNPLEFHVSEDNPNFSADENGILYNKDKSILIKYPSGKTTKSFSVPEGVVEIEEYAFAHCDYIRTIQLPDSLKTIEQGAFGDCPALKEVSFGNNVETIGPSAFNDCISLTSISLPESITSVGDYAFWECYGLVSAEFRSANPELGKGIFEDCTSLSSFVVPSGVKVLPEYTFRGCSALETVTLPEGLTTIDFLAFQYNDALKEITIPNTVTTIECNFSSCPSLESIEIPASVTEIDTYCFGECPSLNAIHVDENNKNYCSVNGVLYNKSKTELLHCPGGYQGILTIPASLNTEIDFYTALSGCNGITSVTVEEGNTLYSSVDGVLANKDGTALLYYPNAKADRVYSIPAAITELGGYFMDNPKNLETLIIDANVTTFNVDFYSCENLKTLIFGEDFALSGVSLYLPKIEQLILQNPEFAPYVSCAAYDGSMINTYVPKDSILPNQVDEYSSANCIIMEEAHEHIRYLSAYTACTDAADGTAVYSCWCGYSESVTVHRPGETVTIEPSCQPGKTYSICQNCSEEVVYETAEANGNHDYVLTNTELGSCQEATSYLYTCSHCQDTKTVYEQDMHHDYEITVVAPTCAAKGYTLSVCGTCGEVLVYDFTPTSGHQYENGICTVCSVGNTLSDYTYTADKTNRTVTLSKYVGSNTDVIVAGKYLLDGVVYDTLLDATTVFKGNTTITSVAIMDGVMPAFDSMSEMFYGCAQLKTVDLTGLDTSGVKSFYRLFSECKKLVSIDVTGLNTASVENMGLLFDYCNALTTITGYENWNTSSVWNINKAFNRMTSIEKVDISNWDLSQVTNSGWCFQLCYAKEILLPDNLAIMSAGFFNHPTKVTGSSYVIPEGVKKIGYAHTIYDFATDDFVEFIVAEGNTHYKAVDGILYSMDGTELIAIPRGKTFENGVYEIPNSVTFMGELSFSRNYNIETIVLPDNFIIEYIPLYDEQYTIEDGHGGDDRGNLNSGTNLSIAIYCYTGITQYDVRDTNPNYTAIDGVIYTKDMTSVVAIPARYAQNLNIPEGVTTWNKEALWADLAGNSNLLDLLKNCTGVSIPSTLTEIDPEQLAMLNLLADRTTSQFLIKVAEGNTHFYVNSETGHLMRRFDPDTGVHYCPNDDEVCTSEIVAPTCKDQGYTIYTCPVCGHSYNDTYTSATGHSFTAYKSNNDATCTVDGTKTATCDHDDCTETNTVTEEGSATGHSYTTKVSEKEATPATCEYPAYNYLRCDNCDEVSTKDVVAVGDKLGHVDANTDHTCDRNCGKTDIGECVDSAEDKDHVCDYGCKKVLENCTGGKAVTENIVSATCTEDGSYDTVVYCTVCGEEVSRETTTVPATGHTEETIPAVVATCTKTGLTEGTKCSVCGETLVAQTETKALNHSYTTKASESLASAATCEEAATYYTQCDRCDVVSTTETVAVGEKLGHTDTNTDHACDRDCGKTDMGQCADSAEDKDHVCDYGCKKVIENCTGGEAVTENTVAATCTADGSYDTVVYCSICDKELSLETTVVPSTGHTEETIPAVEATCLETGLTEGTKCSVCGETLFAQNEIPALNHSFTNYASNNDATCTEDGTKTAVCDRDGCQVTDTIDDVDTAIGHTWDEGVVTTPATADEDGVKTHTCTVKDCGASKTETIPALGHKFDDGVVTKDPTCTKPGVKTFTCQNCENHTYPEEIPATGHSYNTKVTAPTCTDRGYTTYICSSCNHSYQDNFVTATGHNYDSGKVTTAATCAKAGVKTFTCSCGHTKTEVIPVIGHTEVTDKAVAATCLETGLTEGKHCSVCNTVTVKQETVARLPHKWDEGKTTKTPTTDKAGEKTFTCTVCKTTKTEEIPALGVCDGKDDCPLQKFGDVDSSHWAHPGMDFAVNNGLMNGTGSGSTFEPNTNMSRAMLVTVLWRYSGSPDAPACSFKDVTKDDWFYKAVAWAASEGVVTGTGDGSTFAPNDNVTREMMATILYRYAKMNGVDVSASASITGYPDAKSVASWSSAPVKWAVAEGIISGAVKDGKTVLAPQDSANRAVVATIMMRFIQNVVES